MIFHSQLATRHSQLLFCLLVLAVARPAWGVKVADITRISGQRTNELVSFGLVVGLKGTGDGGEYLPAVKPLAALLSNLGDATTVKELANSKNVALVVVTATIPRDGVRDGDELDCQVSAVGSATSLDGGRLFAAPMTGPTRNSGIYAMAHGPVTLEDPTRPLVGIVKRGCVMEADLPAKYIEAGRFTLVLDTPVAGWPASNAIAQVINEELDPTNRQSVAVAVDPKNVIVTLPPEERERPDSFITRVQLLPVRIQGAEARVVINERTGTLTLTGDVEIEPVVISHKGLTISTVNPPPQPAPGRPVVTRKDVVTVDTTGQGGAKLQDLVNALEQLKVPADDRITIIKELYKTGKLHAHLVTEQ